MHLAPKSSTVTPKRGALGAGVGGVGGATIGYALGGPVAALGVGVGGAALGHFAEEGIKK